MSANTDGELITNKIEEEREKLLQKLEIIKEKLDIENSVFNEFWDECRLLELELRTEVNISQEILINASYKITSLDKKIDKKVLPFGVSIMFMIIIILYGLMIIYLRSQGGGETSSFTTVYSFLSKLFIGTIGFIAYFFSDLIKRTRNVMNNLVLAILFPLILVSVFSSDFKTIDFMSLDFLCLAAGFNVGIVLNLLGVIVDKANSFIEKL